MLERTATGIEPCSTSFQRIFPSAGSCLPTRRTLHAAFWHHGAADLGHFDTCQPLVRHTPAEATKIPTATPRSKPKPLENAYPVTAPGFSLDFLYPSGTAALLQRVHRIHGHRLDHGSRSRTPVSRLFTSTAPLRSDQRPWDDPEAATGQAAGNPEDVHEEDDWGPQRELERWEGDDDGGGNSGNAGNGGNDGRGRRDGWDGWDRDQGHPVDGAADINGDVDVTLNRLKRLLYSPTNTGGYDQIYQNYMGLPPDMQEPFKADVMVAISASDRPIEAGRVTDLFAQFRMSQWTDDLLAAATRALFVLNRIQDAVSLFRVAVEHRRLSGGLDRILAHGLETKSFDLVTLVWRLYTTNIKDPKPPPDAPPQSSPRLPVVNHLIYPLTAEVPDLHLRFRELYFYYGDPDVKPWLLKPWLIKPWRTEFIGSIIRHLLTHSLELLKEPDTVFMLHWVKDPKEYERYILLNHQRGAKPRLMTDLYYRYRSLPSVIPDASILRIMMDILFPLNVVGMLRLKTDWYRGYGRLDERALDKFMSFYADRGDVKTLLDLTEEYEQHHPGSNLKHDPIFIGFLARAYAVRGDPKGVRQVLADVTERTGGGPSVELLNHLLKAYSNVGEYEEAINIFSLILEQHEPDPTTFATMMSMAGDRGDLQFTLEVFKLVEDRGLPITCDLIQPVVEAYCRNDRYADAERLCIKITRKKEVPGPHTPLWNTLIRHNAWGRDLIGVNRLLQHMTSLNVSYDHTTYAHLILALLYVNQSHHALHLLRAALDEGSFEPTQDHYILLMVAFIHTQESWLAFKVYDLMRRTGFPESAAATAQYITAFANYRRLQIDDKYTLKLKRRFAGFILREFYRAMEREENNEPDSNGAIIHLYSKTLLALTRMREYASVNRIIKIHNERYPDRGTPETMPLEILHLVLLAQFRSRKIARVRKTWEIILRRTSRRYQPAASFLNPEGEGYDPENPVNPIVPDQRFRLSEPLRVMQYVHIDAGDSIGLIKLVETVRARGYELDNKNWNYHVQGLADMGRWHRAFTTCERVLMPNWAGWAALTGPRSKRSHLPMDLRQGGHNPRLFRPTNHTLLVLIREYRNLERMAPWSRTAAHHFRLINADCPKTVRAIISRRTGRHSLDELIIEKRLRFAGAAALQKKREGIKRSQRAKRRLHPRGSGRYAPQGVRARIKRMARIRGHIADGTVIRGGKTGAKTMRELRKLQIEKKEKIRAQNRQPRWEEQDRQDRQDIEDLQKLLESRELQERQEAQTARAQKQPEDMAPRTSTSDEAEPWAGLEGFDLGDMDDNSSGKREKGDKKSLSVDDFISALKGEPVGGSAVPADSGETGEQNKRNTKKKKSKKDKEWGDGAMSPDDFIKAMKGGGGDEEK
ncbi:hypothetical protein B0J18DRAFT_418312 [Chaetomium sp. MPI-SDFR-AT-0129]|nr:hypothetical protein B0J18DRAFT_418312 [Chaetomium sp. MPI-SDFR-AT-0129]